MGRYQYAYYIADNHGGGYKHRGVLQSGLFEAPEQAA